MASERADAPAAPRALGFRADIQGLRALAVGIVVVNHLFGDVLSGGFVGVDVFLVVSGYLITALMLREIDAEGRLSLRGFYARRARRILPAATLVVVLTVVASVLTVALLRSREILTDAVWSTFFAANVRFASVGTDYFADGSPPSPLRHYWSLAVEEQFYLVWPLVLVACLAWTLKRNAGDPARLRRVAPVVLGTVVVASLAWSVWATSTSPATAYYSTFARGYELGIGALLAFLPQTVVLTRRARELLAGAGWLLIVFAALTFDAETAFPGAAALVPVLGAAALLLAGRDGQDALGTRVLTVRPAVHLGNWSYSLYLIHWPVIVLVGANLAPEDFTFGVKVGLLVAVVALSWVSYEWVENPFRKARPFRSVRGGLAVYPASIALALGVVVASSVVVEHRLANPSGGAPVTVADQPQVADEPGEDTLVQLVEASVLEADKGRGITGQLTPSLGDLESSLADLGGCDYTTGTRDLCPMGDVDAPRDLVVLGDSLARAMSPAAVRLGEEYGYRVHLLGFAGCPATSLSMPENGTRKVWKECENFKKWSLAQVAKIKPEVVLVASSANRVFHPRTGKIVKESDPAFGRIARQGWRDLFGTLKKDAQRVVAFANTPYLPLAPGECLTDGSPDLKDCTFSPDEKAAAQAQWLMSASRGAGAEVVDASQWFCAQGRCPMVVGEYVTLRDRHHMTPQYARELADPLAEELGITPLGEEGPPSPSPTEATTPAAPAQP